jgi:hypothetical protein
MYKKKKRKKSYLSISITYLILGSGAYAIRKRREGSLRENHIEKYGKKQVYKKGMSIFFEPIPEKIRL